MPSPREEAARFVRHIMEAHLQAFWDDLDFVWKPRLKNELGLAAQRGLGHMRRALAEQGTAPARPSDLAAAKFALGRDVLKIAQEQARTARATLEEMATAQARTLQDALTMNGLAGDPQAMASRRRARGGSLPRLATGPGLEESVRKSALEFLRRALPVLGQADQDARLQALQRAAGSWQSRLHAIALTVAQATAGNVYDAVNRSLA